MLEAGLFAGQRFELIDGDLIDKMGQGPQHSMTIRVFVESLLKTFPARQICVQSPINAGPSDREWSQPEPDIAVLREAKPDFAKRHPNGDELLLAIEVADSSLRKDATRKRELYANACVPEYWVLDIEGRCLLVYRSLSNGDYTESLTLTENDLAPHIQLPVSSLIA